MASYFEIICAVIALLLAIYYFSTSTFDFWKNRGISGPRPLPFLGNTKDLMFLRVTPAHYVKEMYEKYKGEPFIGLYMRRTPFLIINDPEFIKDVFIRDFSIFNERGTNTHERMEPLSAHLFHLEPERWRPLRTRLSPIFTSGKIKEMFNLIVQCSRYFEIYLDKLVKAESEIECLELTAKFTTDTIGSCAFGISMNAMADENSEFRKIGKGVFAATPINVIKLKIKEFAPKLYDLLGYVIPERKQTQFFTKVVMDSINYREKNSIVRPDFINMLMELRKHPEKLKNVELTDTLLTAQAFVFFVAGFETSSSTMSNALYELALNQEAQDKLREEIKKHCPTNKDWDIEIIKKMGYLDKVFKESLRMYPPGPFIMRKAASNYTFRGTKVTIPAGIRVWIPIFAIHRDPDIYPNPDKFDPERFSEDAIASRHPMNYLPFGHGPRNCIGARFAVYQTKVGLITILRNYKVEISENTMIPYRFSAGSFLLAADGGIYLKFTKLQN